MRVTNFTALANLVFDVEPCCVASFVFDVEPRCVASLVSFFNNELRLHWRALNLMTNFVFIDELHLRWWTPNLVSNDELRTSFPMTSFVFDVKSHFQWWDSNLVSNDELHILFPTTSFVVWDEVRHCNDPRHAHYELRRSKVKWLADNLWRCMRVEER